MLILDFDGVICDALTECALVTWLGVHPPSPNTPVSAYAAAMPRGFVERFRTIRDYARTLDHFVTAHRPMAAYLTSQAAFDRLFASIADVFVAEFTAQAAAARARCREEEPEFWTGLHTLYPGVEDLLRRHAGKVCIVTAKDEDSAWRILRHHEVDDTVLEIVGESSRKADAVRALSERHGVDVADNTFIDDNLTNAVQVAATGARALWATWGYHTPEHEEQADRAGLPRLRLSDLADLTA
jgi:phosphoglycolate phosphatase-like HAD superfamily hydrolase